MDYATVKVIHVTAVVLSVTGFTARAAGALVGASWVRHRVARTLPHAVDTVLLGSAISLAWMARLNPSATPWLAAKIAGLLVYIVLGMIALRPHRPLAALAALATVGWIASVAMTKNPLGLLTLLA